MSFVWTLFIPIAKYYIFQILRKPAPVLKPGDWEKSSNGRQWKPQLGFNRDRRPVHLDPSAFRTLGWVVAFYLCIFAFSESSQSIKPAFMPQIFETIKYYYFVGILMTSILFCFFFFFFNSFLFGLLLLCVAWEFQYFLFKRFCYPSDQLFQKNKTFFYPQENVSQINIWQGLCLSVNRTSVPTEPPAPWVLPNPVLEQQCLTVGLSLHFWPVSEIKSILICLLVLCISSYVNFCFFILCPY